MCTIMTVSSDHYTDELVEQIREDALYNSDGFGLVLVNAGELSTVVRSMDIETIIDTLACSPWERMFLHCRMATNGSVSLVNTHGWDFGGTFIMHNGILRGADADRFAVDSMAIGQWVCDGGINLALTNLRAQPFANVLMVVEDSLAYTVSRSLAGSLYTDWKGNFSTNEMGELSFLVPCYYTVTHTFQDTAPVAKAG